MYGRRWVRSPLVNSYMVGGGQGLLCKFIYGRRWARSPLVDACMIGGGQGLLW